MEVYLLEPGLNLHGCTLSLNIHQAPWKLEASTGQIIVFSEAFHETQISPHFMTIEETSTWLHFYMSTVFQWLFFLSPSVTSWPTH
jgi:hypothetical protein